MLKNLFHLALKLSILNSFVKSFRYYTNTFYKHDLKNRLQKSILILPNQYSANAKIRKLNSSIKKL